VPYENRSSVRTSLTSRLRRQCLQAGLETRPVYLASNGNSTVTRASCRVLELHSPSRLNWQIPCVDARLAEPMTGRRRIWALSRASDGVSGVRVFPSKYRRSVVLTVQLAGLARSVRRCCRQNDSSTVVSLRRLEGVVARGLFRQQSQQDKAI